MLTVQQLSIAPFLKEVTFTLGSGETMALVGRSGCGKTTLLKSIAGFVDKISTGTITLEGFLWQDKNGTYLPASSRPAVLLFQESAVWPHLTVQQQLDLVGQKDELLATQLGLNPKTPGRALSGGEKQRLALGRVLKTKARILLLDEPFASLDAQIKAKMIKLLATYQAVHKSSILMATHDPSDAKAFGAHVMELL